MDWMHRLSHPVRDTHGNRIRTLNDARIYMIALEERRRGITGQKHWQTAARVLLSATEDGNVEAVTRKLILALLMDGLLDMRQEVGL
jgi:hypothetical protein